MQHDLNKIAADMKRAHEEGRSIRLPALKVRELGALLGILRKTSFESPVSALAH